MFWSLSHLQPVNISIALWTPVFQLYPVGYHSLLSRVILMCRFPRLGQWEPLQLAPLSCAGSLSSSEHFFAFLHDKVFQAHRILFKNQSFLQELQGVLPVETSHRDQDLGPGPGHCSSMSRTRRHVCVPLSHLDFFLGPSTYWKSHVHSSISKHCWRSRATVFILIFSPSILVMPKLMLSTSLRLPYPPLGCPTPIPDSLSSPLWFWVASHPKFPMAQTLASPCTT